MITLLLGIGIPSLITFGLIWIFSNKDEKTEMKSVVSSTKLNLPNQITGYSAQELVRKIEVDINAFNKRSKSFDEYRKVSEGRRNYILIAKKISYLFANIYSGNDIPAHTDKGYQIYLEGNAKNKAIGKFHQETPYSETTWRTVHGYERFSIPFPSMRRHPMIYKGYKVEDYSRHKMISFMYWFQGMKFDATINSAGYDDGVSPAENMISPF